MDCTGSRECSWSEGRTEYFPTIDEHDAVGSWGQFVVVYLEDRVVFSQSIEEKLYHMRTVLGLFSRASVSLKLKTCYLFNEPIDYLEHIIKPGTLAI